IDETGAFYSTRSILQILKQTKNTIAKGIVRDFPRYETRGFMLDVGRKPITMDYLEETTKLMSWYKMNDFQVHLNDNEIWFYQDYENWQDGYAAFRLESETFPEITAKDLSYTKKEFGEFIDKSELYGVDIVPEIDVPAHSLAFTKAFPELRQGDGRKADHLDVRNPETFKFVDALFNEYIGGENPVFRDQDFHIGTDEYNGDNEGFRMFTNNYLDFVKDNGRTPRLWGSLSQIGGQPSVPGEGATMNIWNLGWADPVAMINEGFDIINTDDSNLYMVPGANYYRDYLNYKSLYENWEPNTFRGNYSYKIPAGHPQLKGGMFAIWNDLIGARANGISELDIFDRMMPAVQVLSEKMWSTDNEKSFNEFKDVADEVGTAPNTNPRYEVASVGETLIDYDFNNGSENEMVDNSGNNYNATGSNVEVIDGEDGKAISFKGESSFVDTPVENKGPNYTATFKVKKDGNGDFSEQILSESKNGSLKACQKDTGKVGFSREFYDFSFNYQLPEDQWVELTFVGEMTKTSLYVNGELVDTVSTTSDHGKYGTFALPLDKIGSETNSFKGAIDDVQVKNIAEKPIDPTLIPQSEMTATATSEHTAAGNEGYASYAIDGNENTIWHTDWAGVTFPQNITLNLGGEHTIN
ncbi:family 20 glycosylhydrolase, partial [Clostridium tarantellae]